MPRLWSETVETHRHEVREAIQDAAARLVSEQGLRSVTMSQIAEETRIGRATLYKYYPDVESILRAWHQRQIEGHLEQLVQARDSEESPGGRLEGFLSAYAAIARESRRHRDSELATLLHRRHHLTKAEERLRKMLVELLRDASNGGAVRRDVSPDELTAYCLHALGAASTLPSGAAVTRLVEVTIAGLKPSK